MANNHRQILIILWFKPPTNIFLVFGHKFKQQLQEFLSWKMTILGWNKLMDLHSLRKFQKTWIAVMMKPFSIWWITVSELAGIFQKQPQMSGYRLFRIYFRLCLWFIILTQRKRSMLYQHRVFDFTNQLSFLNVVIYILTNQMGCAFPCCLRFTYSIISSLWLLLASKLFSSHM